MTIHFWLIAPAVFALWAVASFPLAVLVGRFIHFGMGEGNGG